jgi:hypothetical protein
METGERWKHSEQSVDGNNDEMTSFMNDFEVAQGPTIHKFAFLNAINMLSLRPMDFPY